MREESPTSYSPYSKAQLLNYILGESSEIETADIENSLQNSPELAASINRLRTTLKENLYRSELHQANQSSRQYVKRKVYTKLAFGFAVLLSIVSTAVFIFRTSPSALSLTDFNHAIEQHAPQMILQDSSSNVAITAYNQQNYPLARKEFKKCLMQKNEPLLRFYLIAANLFDTKTNITTEQLTTFDKQLSDIAKTETLLHEEVPFLRAIVAFRLNKTDDTKVFLQQTIDKNGEYKSIATALLEKL